MSELDGRVALVTGAGRGLGRSYALALAAAGAAVVVNDTGCTLEGEAGDATPAADVVRDIVANGGRAVASADSVADWDGARAIVDTAITTFGSLDIVVNNAGISRLGAIGEISREDWEQTIAVNLNGHAFISHWAAVHWVAIGPRGGRAIVNTASPAGTHPIPTVPAYSASKAGVLALTITSAAELAPLGVRVNALVPMARTRMTEAAAPLLEIYGKRDPVFDRADPDNVAPLVVYLASPRCRFTGRVFGIEGDDVFLFEGWSASHAFGNGAKRWSPEALERALASAPLQDRGLMIAPSMHGPGCQPDDETLAIVAEIAEQQQ